MGRRREQGGAPRPSGLSDVTPPRRRGAPGGKSEPEGKVNVRAVRLRRVIFLTAEMTNEMTERRANVP